MVNLYALLGLRYDASQAEIQAAMKKAAANQTMTLEQLQKCKEWLLNPGIRGKYNEKLLAAFPDLIIQYQAVDIESKYNYEAIYPTGFVDLFKFFNVPFDVSITKMQKLITQASDDGVDDSIISQAEKVFFNEQSRTIHAAQCNQVAKNHLKNNARNKTSNNFTRKMDELNKKSLSGKEIALYTGALFAFCFIGVIIMDLFSPNDKEKQNIQSQIPQASVEKKANQDKINQDKLNQIEKYKLPSPSRIPTIEPNITYDLLYLMPAPKSDAFDIIVKQQGTTFTGYSRKRVYCYDKTFEYLGEGDSLLEAMKDRPSPRSAVNIGSTAEAQLTFACSWLHNN